MPGPGNRISLALYWSPNPWRATTTGLSQWPTSRGTFAQMIGSARNRALMNLQHLGNLALTEPVAEAQAQEQDFLLVNACQPIARGVGKDLAPTGFNFAAGRHGHGQIVVGKRLGQRVPAQL